MYAVIKKIIRLVLQKLYYLFFILPIDCYFNIKSFWGLYHEVEYEYNKKFGDKICVFASFPINGTLTKNLKNYLFNLNDLGYSIIFVSNAPIVSEGLEWLKSLCHRVIIRENFGRDFGAYKTGIIKYKDNILNAKELLIANDSVIHLIDFKKMFDYMNTKNTDVWSITEAYGRALYQGYHLCSYFLVFSKKALNSATFWNFWKNYRMSQSRAHAIEHGELSLTTTIKKAGFYTLAYLNTSKLYHFFVTKHFNNIFCNNFLCNRMRMHTQTEISKELIIEILYSQNHNVFFIKALLEMGLPLIKKDIFSKCFYFADEILALLKKLEIADTDEIITELLSQVKSTNSFKDTFLMVIGEK